MFRNTTGQVVPELPLEKSRNRTLACLRTRKERLQLFDYDAIENGLFRLAGNIFELSVRHEALEAGGKPTPVVVASGTF